MRLRKRRSGSPQISMCQWFHPKNYHRDASSRVFAVFVDAWSQRPFLQCPGLFRSWNGQTGGSSFLNQERASVER